MKVMAEDLLFRHFLFGNTAMSKRQKP